MEDDMPNGNKKMKCKLCINLNKKVLFHHEKGKCYIKNIFISKIRGANEWFKYLIKYVLWTMIFWNNNFSNYIHDKKFICH
ncbi:MAG: hypothetical protein Ta2E_01880 [Mycoplasmoidaceae bacterium]|nr:MAG: hypothetical protein Ta2E_01880 [Mycoplasmoidaceae bacterium]